MGEMRQAYQGSGCQQRLLLGRAVTRLYVVSFWCGSAAWLLPPPRPPPRPPAIHAAVTILPNINAHWVQFNFLSDWLCISRSQYLSVRSLAVRKFYLSCSQISCELVRSYSQSLPALLICFHYCLSAMLNQYCCGGRVRWGSCLQWSQAWRRLLRQHSGETRARTARTY